MRALREFRYFDHEQHRSVVIAPGQEINPDRMTANKVDLDKLVRTKHVAQVESVEVQASREQGVVKRKRGRPRKTVT